MATALSSALAGAALNLATGTLDHPRALESFLHLGLPLASGFLALLVVALPAFLLLDASGRALGLARGALAAAGQVAFVLAAGLAPMVEVGLRQTSSARATVVLACAAGFVGAAALATYALAARRGEPQSGGAHAQAALVAATLVALGVSWQLEYSGTGPLARGLALCIAALALLGAARGARQLARVHAVAAATALCLALGAMDALQVPRTAPPRAHANAELTPVVLLTVDTLRADRVLGEAATRVPTPGIDALAADSVVFTHARSAAPWTKPSLATLLTGLSPLVHGMTNRRARLAPEIETLPERLHAAGYRTAGIGLNAHLERAFRFDQGFDDYAFPARPDYGISIGSRVLERLDPERFPELFPSSTAIADVAVDWLDEHAAEPFFLWVHMLDPHWPYEPPARWLEHPDAEPRRWGEPEMVTNVQAGNTKPGAEERVRVQELYAGEIRYVDAELARIVAALRRHGLYERALIVFASDHGEEFWEHGHYEHGHTLYDEVLRVPLAFKLPGEGPRARLDAPVSTQALAPTVLDLLGLAFDPALLSSRSLAPWWRTPGEAKGEPSFASGTYYFGEKRGLVLDGLKLVVELDTGRAELYDLEQDPRELRNLAAARPDEVRRRLEQMEAWQKGCDDLRKTLGLRESDGPSADDATLRRLEELGYAGSQ